MMDPRSAGKVACLGVTHQYDRPDRHLRNQRPRLDRPLGVPDMQVGRAVDRFPDDVAAGAIAPAETPLAAVADADTLGADAAPAENSTVGMIEKPSIQRRIASE